MTEKVAKEQNEENTEEKHKEKSREIKELCFSGACNIMASI